jgi:DHA1 family tetracycline resistance protein-like MFS transporter
MTSPTPAQTERRQRLPLLVVVAADAVAGGLILPVLPFIALNLHVGSLAIGVLVASFNVAQLVAAPFWGALADRWGTRPLLLCAPLVSAAGHLVLAFSTDYPLLLAGRVIAGFGGSIVLLVQIHVSTTGEGGSRTAAVGRVSAVQGIGTILGPALGGMIAAGGTLAVGLAAAGASLVAATLAAIFVPKTPKGAVRKPRPRGSIALVAKVPALRPLGMIMILGWLCFAGYTAILPVHLEQRLGVTAAVFGYVVAVSGAIAFVVRGLLLGKLVRRFGERRLLVAGGVLLAGALALAPVLPTVWSTPLLPLLWAGGAGLLFPCVVGEIGRNAPAGTTGMALGAGTMLAGVGRVAGPVAAGALLQVAVPAVPFVGGAVVLVAVCVLGVSALPHPKSEPQGAS